METLRRYGPVLAQITQYFPTIQVSFFEDALSASTKWVLASPAPGYFPSTSIEQFSDRIFSHYGEKLSDFVDAAAQIGFCTD